MPSGGHTAKLGGRSRVWQWLCLEEVCQPHPACLPRRRDAEQLQVEACYLLSTHLVPFLEHQHSQPCPHHPHGTSSLSPVASPPALSHGPPASSLPPPFPSRHCTSPCKVTALPGWSAAEAVCQAVQGIVAAAAPEAVPRAQVRTWGAPRPGAWRGGQWQSIQDSLKLWRKFSKLNEKSPNLSWMRLGRGFNISFTLPGAYLLISFPALSTKICAAQRDPRDPPPPRPSSSPSLGCTGVPVSLAIFCSSHRILADVVREEGWVGLSLVSPCPGRLGSQSHHSARMTLGSESPTSGWHAAQPRCPDSRSSLSKVRVCFHLDWFPKC